jgi:signal peptidase II
MTIWIAIFITAADQLIKYIVQHQMELGETIPIIRNVFHLTYIINPGAAFGVLANQTWIFLGIAVLLFAGFFVCRNRIPKEPRYFPAAIGLVLGGALGNAIDRFRIHGVVDYLDFRVWPIFNLADIAICVGVALILIFYWRHDKK